MDPSRFGSAAGRLTQARVGNQAYWAFVPAPLPPALKPDAELMRLSSQAAYALGELAALGRGLANPHLLLGPFLRREAVLSSRIEGTQAGIADLYAYEAGQIAPARGQPLPPADVQEVLNYVRALEHGVARLPDLPVGLRLIREVHACLMEGVRGQAAGPGEFRQVQNWIGRHGCTPADADYVPPPVPEMLEALDAFDCYLQAFSDEYPPLVRLAFIHYQFEAVHPFLDGNGRVGRLLSSLLLVNWQLLPLPLLYLSAFFERRRAAYYELLLEVSASGAWREWTLFFLQGVLEQARDASDRSRSLHDLQARWRERLTGARAPALALKLAESLFVSPILTIPQAQKVLEVGYPTAQRAVEKLIQAGILRPITEANYGKAYVAEEIIAIVNEALPSTDQNHRLWGVP